MEKFEIILYFNRKVKSPSKPVFEEVQKSNPLMTMDELLDLFSDLRIKYNNKEENTIISDYIMIPEDEKFYDKVKEFEKNSFFIDWHKDSKRLINTILQTSK